MPTAHLPGKLRLYYEDDNFTDPWAPSETVILHHGNAKNAQLWYAWVPLLAGEFRVIRLDARGFGKSSIPEPGYPWSLEGFAADLANLMDYLEIEKAHVVGETIGGTIALQFAYQFPQRLHTVTTCTSPYKFRGVPTYLEYYNLVKEQGVKAWVRQTADRRLEPGKSDPRHHAWYVQQMSQTSQQVVMETLAYLSTVDLTPILPQITTPALVMVGELSTMNTARPRAAHGRPVAARDPEASAWSEWLRAALCTGAVCGAMAGLCHDLQASLRRARFPDNDAGRGVHLCRARPALGLAWRVEGVTHAEGAGRAG